MMVFLLLGLIRHLPETNPEYPGTLNVGRCV